MGHPLLKRLVLPALLLVAAALLLLLQAGGGQEILYLNWAENGTAQLFRLSLYEEEAEQLTRIPAGVDEYAASPDGRQVAFTTSGNKGSEIWRINSRGRGEELLLACHGFDCRGLVWHADSRRLLYERRQLIENGVAGTPRLWWLDSRFGETVPLMEDASGPSQAAAFSPDGNWVSFNGSPDEGVFAFNLQDGRLMQTASEMGTAAPWSPDSSRILVRNNQLVVLHGDEEPDHLDHTHDFTLGVYLFLVDVVDGVDLVDGGRQLSLSGDDTVDDGSAVWSPDGAWIAFGRKRPRTIMGRQLWLVRPDGSEAHALTDAPEIHHGIPSWSADGRLLLFQRFPTMEENGRPSIWTFDVGSHEMRQAAADGFQPSWLP